MHRLLHLQMRRRLSGAVLKKTLPDHAAGPVELVHGLDKGMALRHTHQRLRQQRVKYYLPDGATAQQKRFARGHVRLQFIGSVQPALHLLA